MFVFLGIVIIVLGAISAIILQGLRKIPPVYVALVTKWGKRVPEVVSEGWQFFPLYPTWYGYIPIKVETVSKDFAPEEVRTPDGADLNISVALSWAPDKDSPEALINYLNAGGEGHGDDETGEGEPRGVRDILEDMVAEHVREWARSTKLGPQTWRDALSAGDEAVQIILEGLLGKPISPEEINSYKCGAASVSIPSLGITISRLNIKDITLTGKVAEAAELKVKEELERDAEAVEQEHVKNMILKHTEQGFSKEQALEIVQTERGKVAKNVSEHKLSISSETGDILKNLLMGIVPFLSLGKPGKTKEGGDQ